MRKTWVAGAFLAVAALLGGMTLVVHAQGLGPQDIGHWLPLSGPYQGVYDSWNGICVYIDPADPKKVVVLDLVHAQYGVRALEEGKATWQASNYLQGASLPAKREVNFVQVENKLELVDTRNGDVYGIDGAMQGKASDWKEGAVSAVLTNLTSPSGCKRAKQALKKGGG